uniref:hypothetical protein n=1 Tax=Campylobacter fetus TaxID=196 RepID=UPI003AF8EAA7
VVVPNTLERSTFTLSAAISPAFTEVLASPAFRVIDDLALRFPTDIALTPFAFIDIAPLLAVITPVVNPFALFAFILKSPSKAEEALDIVTFPVFSIDKLVVAPFKEAIVD